MAVTKFTVLTIVEFKKSFFVWLGVIQLVFIFVICKIRWIASNLAEGYDVK